MLPNRSGVLEWQLLGLGPSVPKTRGKNVVNDDPKSSARSEKGLRCPQLDFEHFVVLF